MANNQHVNKVEFENQVVMDISDTTASASDVLSGKKFYSASGAPATGTLVPGTITEVQANGTSVATSGIANIPAASTSGYGVTKLNNTTSSTSTNEAATAAVAKQLNDKIGDVESTDLQSQVDLINRNLDPLITSKTWSGYTTPTLSNGSQYRTGCAYAKFGAFVHIYISVQFDSAPTNALLWQMPSGFIPIGDVQLAASGGGSYNAKAQAIVGSDGGVRVTSVDRWVSASGIYFVTT